MCVRAYYGGLPSRLAGVEYLNYFLVKFYQGSWKRYRITCGSCMMGLQHTSASCSMARKSSILWKVVRSGWTHCMHGPHSSDHTDGLVEGRGGLND